MIKLFNLRALLAGITGAAIIAAAGGVFASHSWGPYHWARSVNPFTLKLGDNVTSVWDAYLVESSSDWSISSVLDTAIVAGGTSRKNCRPTAGRIEVCNAAYGNNGWLGLAQIWINSSSHITQAVAKMNDTYFNTAAYNTPAWRRFVVCQEIAHGFGLAHQDENFWNPNLGSCMDYTADPDGPLSNEHPNQHDYDQLEAIYAHLDSSTPTVKLGLPPSTKSDNGDGEIELGEPRQWGKALRKGGDGRPSLYERDLGAGHKVFTFVIWAK